jgi:hypothetical protein
MERESGALTFSNQSFALRLHANRSNRILLFLGSFFPPHLGHLELVTHIFLRTDPSTIAALIFPTGSGQCTKQNATVKGRTVLLDQDERFKLLQDEVLSRFSRIYNGDWDLLHNFRSTLIRQARMGGYELAFTVVSGSDYWNADSDAISSVFHAGGFITSNITRSSALLRER